MSNVIKIDREKKRNTSPDDLISIREFMTKHSVKKGYLYKLYYNEKIKRYKRGVYKISESEVLKVLDNMGRAV